MAPGFSLVPQRGPLCRRWMSVFIVRQGPIIVAIEGILNGTTNFILTKMEFDKISYADALSEAQLLGIAETDPIFDVWRI